MEGPARRSVPPVQRSFVSSRLAEDLLSSVYERLLGTERPRVPLLERSRSDDACDGGNKNAEQETPEALATGGRS
jgi:hypothetical protein